MSGTFDKHPELMILIAALVGLAIGSIVTVASCSALLGASNDAVGALPDIAGTVEPHGGMDLDPLDGYSEADVPEQMDIDVPELQDDLQAMMNYDIQNALNLEDEDIKITELSKDEVAAPELQSGQVLCQVSGKATIENADGETGTTGYTSYYYADDPTADKVTWYIYAYDLDDCKLLPDGFEEKAGDPLGVRDYLQTDRGAGKAKDSLGRDKGRDAKSA